MATQQREARSLAEFKRQLRACQSTAAVREITARLSSKVIAEHLPLLKTLLAARVAELRRHS